MIPLPTKYERDIRSRTNSIDTLVVIDNIKIATRSLHLTNEETNERDFYVDRDLSVNSIKQSVDFEKRSFKIGNVTIQISNYKINGSRFSDLFSDKSLVNRKVEVYQMTKSATTVSDCLQLFSGKVRRYSIDERSVSFTIEDSTQEKLHKDLPNSRLPDEEQILEKYRNKLIPSVFGYNDKSPLVYYRSDIQSQDFYWIPDNVLGLDGREAVKIGGFLTKDTHGESIPYPVPSYDALDLNLIYTTENILNTAERQETLRAWKNEWVEVPVDRKTFRTTDKQYMISQDAEYIQMTTDTISQEKLEQEMTNNNISDDQKKIGYLRELTSTTNNLFEGVIFKKPTTLSLLDETFVHDSFGRIVYKGNEGGVGQTEEIVELDNISNNDNVIDITFPKVYDTGSVSERRGITIDLKKETSSVESGFQNANIGTDGEVVMSSGASYDGYKWASQNGCYITQMPTGLQIREYVTTFKNSNNYSWEDLGVTIYGNWDNNGTPVPNASSPYWNTEHYDGESSNFDENVSISSWGRTYAAGRLDKYDFNSPSVDFSINLRNNQLFNSWWLGVAEDGSFGSSEGVAPILKNWTDEEETDEEWYYEYWQHSVTNTHYYIQNMGYSYTGIISAQEFYNIGSFSTSDGDWYNSFYGGVTYFNPATGCYTNFNDSAGSWGITCGEYRRLQGLNSRGYNSVDDADKVSIIKQGSRREQVKVSFNFSDVETQDVIEPIYSDSGSLMIQSYRPHFWSDIYVDTVSVSGNHIFHTSLDNFMNYHIFSTSPTAGNAISQTPQNSTFDFNTLPTVTTKWDNPNDFNDIGISFRFDMDGTDDIEKECQISGRISTPSLSHYINYTNLDKTKFYGRVSGRYDDWDFSTNVRNYLNALDGGTDPYDVSLLEDFNSDDWYLYPKKNVAITGKYYNLDQVNVTGDVNTTKFEADRISIWDIMASLLLESVNIDEEIVIGSDNYIFEVGDMTILDNAINLAYNQGDYKILYQTQLQNEADTVLGSLDQYGQFYATQLQRWIRIINNWWSRSSHVLENPVLIIGSILKQDLDFTGSINQNSLNEAMVVHYNWKFGFTVDKKVNSKKLIEAIASNTRIFPKIRPTDGSLSFVVMKPDYNLEDVNLIIDPLDVIKYKFNLTDIDHVKTKVRVLYKRDPETKEFDRSTDYLVASEALTSYSSDYYGLDSENEDTYLDFESHYIRDEYTALQLRNYLLKYNCNQRLKIDLELPLSYSQIETGDVFHIESLINDFKAYGTDYTTYSEVNGQIKLPFFMVSSVNIKNTVSIQAEQIHYTAENQPSLEGYLESLGFDLDEIETITDQTSDDPVPNSNIIYGCTYPDASNYDPTATSDDGSCTFEANPDFLVGDVNGDGYVNVLDIVQLVNGIVGD